MRWTIPCIAACWLLAAEAAGATGAAGASGPPSSDPTAGRVALPAGGHAVAESPGVRALPADLACLTCHPAQAAVLAGPMARRQAELDFACRAFGEREGPEFFRAACAGCHVTTCGDCHDGQPHAAAPVGDDRCLRCHRGAFTGWDYHGRAPREDHERYQRGREADGEYYLTMLPDVHAERGLRCADCHRVHGGAHGVAAAGDVATRTCRDCHASPAPEVPEHAITAHLEKMECWACHAAWGAQEYGTFLVRPATGAQQEAFAALPEQGGWRRSAALRRQDAPPLGLDGRGLVAPIRPRFVLLATDPARGWENRLLAAEWRPFVPHTIRRGTVTCGGCHEDPRRFVLEPAADRIYDLPRDGLPLVSWWDQTGQRVTGGAFFTQERFDRMNRRTPEYVREHLRQWQDLLQADDGSSRP